MRKLSFIGLCLLLNLLISATAFAYSAENLLQNIYTKTSFQKVAQEYTLVVDDNNEDITRESYILTLDTPYLFEKSIYKEVRLTFYDNDLEYIMYTFSDDWNMPKYNEFKPILLKYYGEPARVEVYKKEGIEATYWFVDDYTIVLTPKQILFGNATVIKNELKDSGEL